MIIVEIKSAATKKTPRTSKAGKPYLEVKQQCYVHGLFEGGFLSDSPRSATVSLGEEDEPYAAGYYAISDESFRVGQWADIQLSFPSLQLLEHHLKEINNQVAPFLKNHQPKAA